MKHYFIAYFFLFFLGLVFFYTVEPEFVANIIGQGGNITRVDLSEPRGIATWAGVSGQLSGGASQISMNDAETVHFQNLNLPSCFQTEIYATTDMAIDWTNLVPASTLDIDNYMGLSPGVSRSATNSFTDNRTYLVNLFSYDLASTETNSISGTFDMGLLKQSNTPVFVTHPVETGLGFDGSPTQYQFMLPVFYGTTTRYYFFIDPNDNCNNLPVFSGLSNIDGYIDEELYVEFAASDLDGDNLTLSMEPYYDFLNLKWKYSPSLLRYEGIINFTPTIAGRYHTNFILSDGKDQIHRRIEFDIGYCGNLDLGGEPSCESRFEGCEVCSQDCGGCRDNRDAAVILHDSQVCAQEQIEIQIFKRFKDDCTPTLQNGILVCGSLSGVNIKIYQLEGLNKIILDDLSTNLQGEVVFRPSISGDYVVVGDESVLKDATRWVLVDELVADSNGRIEFIPPAVGEYKIVGEKSGYYTTYDYLYANDCPGTPVDAEEPTSPTAMVPSIPTEPQPEAPLPVSKEKIPTWLVLLYNAGLILGAIAGIFLIHKKYNS